MNKNTGLTTNSFQYMPFLQTHPARLAGIATLFQLNPPNPQQARVLEIGCASGGNLIPLALYYPQMRITGIDNRHALIEEGTNLIKRLGLENIRLTQLNLSEIEQPIGLFDYIICHGLYSCLPVEEQAIILQICRENLAENGVAYISYHTYPGWKTHELVRDAMQFHTRHFHTLAEKLPQGLAMLELMKSANPSDSTYYQLLDSSYQQLQVEDNPYLQATYFDVQQQPCYFQDFATKAAEHDLIYLGEANFAQMYAQHLNAQLHQQLNHLCENNQIILEQYLDFLNNRSFRQTLLCHKEQAANINRNSQDDSLLTLDYYSTFAVTTESASANPTEEHIFFTEDGHDITTHNATQYWTLKTLQRNQPNHINGKSLQRVVEKVADDFDVEIFFSLIKELLTHGILIPTLGLPKVKLNKAMPSFPKLPQKMLEYGLESGHLVSIYHTQANIYNDIVLQVIAPFFDGEHNLDKLSAELIKQVKTGEIVFKYNNSGEVIKEANDLAQAAREHCKNVIAILNKHGFFTSSSS